MTPRHRPTRQLRSRALMRHVPRYVDDYRLGQRQPHRYLVGYDVVPRPPRVRPTASLNTRRARGVRRSSRATRQRKGA